ncbi:MAG: sulfatase-like hydrolase/transferase [Simkaniaceae bacterium]|nr:MAG: sulfatase-like hydrolase/transferase [Simkaniaceae bacterium]
MHSALGLIGFALPAWIARLYFRRDFSLLGLFQDLFAGAQLGVLSHISPWLIPPFQLLILYDGWVDKKLNFRLDGSCLPLLKQIGDFKDSAKELNLFKIFPLFLPFAFLPSVLQPLSPWLLLLGLPFLYIKTELGKDALLILWEKQVFMILSKPFRKNKKNFLSFAKREILSSQEIYTSKDSSYPLFRYTHGFKGKKELEIEINPDEKPHVMFLFVESLRSKDVGCLGGKHEVTSHLDALAKESYVYSNFYANSFPTFRAFYTSLFGLPYSLEMKTTLSKNIPTYGLPDHLKELGYETNFFTGAHWGIGGIGPFLKQIQADRVFDKKEIEKFNPASTGGSWGIDDEYLLEMTLNHFEKHQNTPQFYSILTITSHHPWVLPKGYVSPEFPDLEEGYYQNYLKTLHYADHQVGNFIRKLKEKKLTKNLLLFVTGDHGLYFGEKNESLEFHRGNHKDNFHVPLMIYADGRIKEPKVIESLASQCDLLPTMMDLLSMKGYQHSIGRSLIRKEKNPRIFYHNSANFKGSVSCREGDTTVLYGQQGDALEEKGLYPILANFKEMLSSIYENNLTVPPKIKKGIKSLSIEPYQPPLEVSSEKLAEIIHQNSPMTALILDQNNHVNQELLSKIAKWNPDLDLLSIKESYSITDQGLAELLKKCDHIHDLNISDCPLLTEKCLKFLPKTLMRLSLQRLDFVNDNAFVEKMRHLEVLDIRETPITDRGFSRFPELFPTLSYLIFSYIHISMDSAEKVIESLPLYRLQIYDGEMLTDKEASLLFKPHPTLRFLNLEGCLNLTDELFTQIKECKLRQVHLSGIPNLTDHGLEALLKLPLDALHITGAPSLSPDAFKLIDRYQQNFVDLSIEVINL